MRLIAREKQPPGPDPVRWSRMTGKLEGIPALNTNPINNYFCTKMHYSDRETICSHCYSFRMLGSYRSNCVPKFSNNGQLLGAGPIDPLQYRREGLGVAAIARFNGHGELHNEQHLTNLYQIAEWSPGVIFALWTKRISLVKTVAHNRMERGLPARPDNVILIYSNPIIDQVMTAPPEHFDKVFNNTLDLTASDNCTGRKCADCRQCYDLTGPVSIIEKIKH